MLVSLMYQLVHKGAVNALKAAGITSGKTTTTFGADQDNHSW